MAGVNFVSPVTVAQKTANFRFRTAPEYDAHWGAAWCIPEWALRGASDWVCWSRPFRFPASREESAMEEKEGKAAATAVGIIVALFVCLVAIHGCDRSNGSSEQAAKPENQAVAVADPAPPPLPISGIAWSAVDAIYNLNSKETDLSKDAKWPKFSGKKVRWTGAVVEVSESLGSLTLQVKMNPDTLTSDLIVTLDDSQRSKALLLKQGDSVTFVGILDSWGSILPITLTDGLIESSQSAAPEPPAAAASPDPDAIPGQLDKAARKNATDFLPRFLPYRYSVVGIEVAKHDQAWEQIGTLQYPISVAVEIEVPTYDGMKKGIVYLACAADGSVIQPLGMPPDFLP